MGGDRIDQQHEGKGERPQHQRDRRIDQRAQQRADDDDAREAHAEMERQSDEHRRA